MKDPYQIILRPLMTEKSNMLSEQNKYVFLVDIRANKIEIRQAVEAIFPDVKGKVLKVNTIRMRGKTKGHFWRYRRGKRPDWKKAIITVEEGTTIPVYEGI